MIDTILSILFVTTITLCIAWIILKIVYLIDRKKGLKADIGGINLSYFANNKASRMTAIGALCSFGLFCIIFDSHPMYNYEDSIFLIFGIIFLVIAAFRLYSLFKFEYKYHQMQKSVTYEIKTDIDNIILQQETKQNIIKPKIVQDNKKYKSILHESTLTPDSLINKPQTSNIFKDIQ